MANNEESEEEEDFGFFQDTKVKNRFDDDPCYSSSDDFVQDSSEFHRKISTSPKKMADEKKLLDHEKEEKSHWIGRMSYKWFCMDQKLLVLHTFPRHFWPTYLDIIREVSRRWKNLEPDRKAHYVQIATYEYEKQQNPQ